MMNTAAGRRSRKFLSWTLCSMLFALPAGARPASVEIVVGHLGDRSTDGIIEISLRALNTTGVPQKLALPEHIAAYVSQGGSGENMWLERSPATPAEVPIPPQGFATLHYRLHLPVPTAQPMLLTVPEWNTPAIAITGVKAPPVHAAAPAPARPPAQSADATIVPAPEAASRHRANHFLGNLSVYEPVYAVYGPGTNSSARLQLSFKYQLFGDRSNSGKRDSWLDGVHFAYTQRMFWDVGARSSPFRNIDFQPEIFYQFSPVRLSEKLVLGGSAGLHHESNGRAGDSSRSYNQLFIRPVATFSLENDYFLRIGPRFVTYVGRISDNPDMQHYRGNTGLFAQIGKENGIQLSTVSNLNFGSGKGSISADLSYPLPELWSGGPDFYLYGQSFVGHGENLLDYNRHTRRLRIGIAVVR